MKKTYWKYYMLNTTAIVLNEFDRTVAAISPELLMAMAQENALYPMTAADHNALLEVLAIEGEAN